MVSLISQIFLNNTSQAIRQKKVVYSNQLNINKPVFEEDYDN